MSSPWVTALKALPWQVILKDGPMLLKAADALLASSRTTSSASANDVQALHHRVADLGAQLEAQAALLKQLADHVNAVTVAAEASAARARQSLIVALVAVAIAVGAAIALFSRP